MKKLTFTGLGLAALLSAVTMYATPLRELIFQAIDKERPGVLSQAEIKAGRTLGAHWHRKYGDYCSQLPVLEKRSAQKTFPGNSSKQKEWRLECDIGFMMDAESKLWDPTR